MADFEYKIAVASSDGIVVNAHFGRADTFYIYRSGDMSKPVEIRNLNPVCEKGNHDMERLKQNIDRLKDCKYILVSRIGNGARTEAESAGIECYEIPGIIEESVNKLKSYLALNDLLKEAIY